MRVVKPNQVSVLSRPFEFNAKYQLGIAGAVLFPFADPRYPLTEAALWTLVGKELEELVLDECMPKQKGEFLLKAHAYTPGGQPQTVVRTAIEFQGNVLKEVAVVGDRVWRGSMPTQPEPFTTKPITWGNAFGGEGFDRNPSGKGFRAENGSPLPNVEDPHRFITSMRQTPDPVGFGPYDLSWPQRQKKAGTYDQKWLDKYFPGLAQDIDWGFFNVAPPDQQIPGFFRGDETVVLHNLHPEHPQLVCKLPEVQLWCLVKRKQRNGTEVDVEVAMRADTLWLFPHASHGILIFHGSTPIREDDARDVNLIYMAVEDLDQPKPRDHYDAVLERRLSKEHGAIAALEDEVLLPRLRPGLDKPPSPAGEMEELLALEHLAYKNMQRKAAREVQTARDMVAAQGLDPDEHGPRPLPEIDQNASVEELIAIAEKGEREAKEAQKQAEETIQRTEEELRVLCNESGIDFDEIQKEWRGPFKGGPPKLVAKSFIARLKKTVADGHAMGFDVSELEEYLADPEFVGRLEETDLVQMNLYWAGAQERSAADHLSEQESQRVRQRVMAAYRDGRSMAKWDLTGANLAGLQIPGADLREALMECCNLSQADLAGANLSKTVLVRTNLRGTRLNDARLVSANLSLADCSGADFTGADMQGTFLTKTRFISSQLEGVRMEMAEFNETVLQECSLKGAKLGSSTFDGMNLARLNFAEADLSDATFLKCRFDDTNFTLANLHMATFLGCRGSRALFPRANVSELRSVEGTELTECDFREANLNDACLRETNLSRSDFTNARANRADFSESDLTEAQLYHLVAKDALFIRTNLTRANLVGADLFEALLSKATILGTDLRGSNLYQADLSLVVGDHATRMEDAITTRARVKPFYTDKVQDLE